MKSYDGEMAAARLSNNASRTVKEFLHSVQFRIQQFDREKTAPGCLSFSPFSVGRACHFPCAARKTILAASCEMVADIDAKTFRTPSPSIA